MHAIPYPLSSVSWSQSLGWLGSFKGGFRNLRIKFKWMLFKNLHSYQHLRLVSSPCGPGFWNYSSNPVFPKCRKYAWRLHHFCHIYYYLLDFFILPLSHFWLKGISKRDFILHYTWKSRIMLRGRQLLIWLIKKRPFMLVTLFVLSS